jgi:hypothetical protein
MLLHDFQAGGYEAEQLGLSAETWKDTAYDTRAMLKSSEKGH